jgi:hypothetical protein
MLCIDVWRIRKQVRNYQYIYDRKDSFWLDVTEILRNTVKIAPKGIRNENQLNKVKQELMKLKRKDDIKELTSKNDGNCQYDIEADFPRVGKDLMWTTQ